MFYEFLQSNINYLLLMKLLVEIFSDFISKKLFKIIEIMKEILKRYTIKFVVKKDIIAIIIEKCNYC